MRKERNVPKHTLRLWQLRVGIVSMLILLTILRLFFITIWSLLPTVIIASLSIIVIFWYLPLFFSRYRIIYDNNSIEIQKGVFFKAIIIMPYPRLVYVSAFSSPFARYLGVSGAVLKAARGFIIIPEIEKDDIKELIKIAAGERN